MIIDNIVKWLESIATWIVNMLPAAGSLTVPNWTNYLVYADRFINMPLLISLCALFLAYEAIVIGIRVIMFVWNLVRP